MACKPNCWLGLVIADKSKPKPKKAIWRRRKPFWQAKNVTLGSNKGGWHQAQVVVPLWDVAPSSMISMQLRVRLAGEEFVWDKQRGRAGVEGTQIFDSIFRNKTIFERESRKTKCHKGEGSIGEKFGSKSSWDQNGI
ncbi:hypothetical protein C8R45DRAFT_947592 [Mycena sanguinolenta]|nr:hypothetical protein C8R45DRAFT_947592 [Mycena sanguinolenta]